MTDGCPPAAILQSKAEVSKVQSWRAAASAGFFWCVSARVIHFSNLLAESSPTDSHSLNRPLI
uniref:Uncharacterized protein n=1 Tax=Anguilla anguilla TaxID=7936 RepID=A0A0E9PVH8_ANGAN